MDINKVLMEYDNMYGNCTLEEIEEFLEDKLAQAKEEKDDGAAVSLLNELVGYCRDTSQQAKGMGYCRDLMLFLDRMKLAGSVQYGTSILNIANLYRAFGYLEESLKLYKKVEVLYLEKLDKNDFEFASLYNNWSLLYQEMGEYVEAANILSKALVIVDRYPKAVMQQATTRTNMAASLFRLAETEEGREDADRIYSTGMKFLTQAIDIYESDGGRDFHYSAALAAMGDALYYKKEYEQSMQFYERAMQELESHVGQTEAYDRIRDNYEIAKEKALSTISEKTEEVSKEVSKETYGKISEDMSEDISIGISGEYKNNLERCRAFYNVYGKKMIREKFGDYESNIAVGLVGEGSDCLGYDDDISKDHDYGVGFCMWVRDDIYEKIGKDLQREYDDLVDKHASEFMDETGVAIMIDKRRGVFTIDYFYESLLKIRALSSKLIVHEYEDEDGVHKSRPAFSEKIWRSFEEENLATATNGEVYRDDEGIFSAIREELLAYYPDNIWRAHLANWMHIFAQSAQYNYSRMMERKDYISANICIARGIESAVKIGCLLDRKYAPYYKWIGKAADDLNSMYGISPILKDIAKRGIDDKTSSSFEAVAAIIVRELNARGMISGNENFLDAYCMQIVDCNVEKETMERKPNKKELVDQIIKEEWSQFDKVKNEGGRADCQDDWNTFNIMRKSQYLAWNDEMLESYLNDLVVAKESGWNLIMEKYARMEKSTAPKKYAELEKKLPFRSEDRIAIQEEIIKIQVAWMEEFAENYPNMAGNSRSIHTSEDNLYNTSYETYLRGELGTYSEATLMLYGRFIVEKEKKGENLAKIIMTNTALLYGYETLEAAESKLG